MNLLVAVLLLLTPISEQSCTSSQGDTVLPGTVVDGACIPLPWPRPQK